MNFRKTCYRVKGVRLSKLRPFLLGGLFVGVLAVIFFPTRGLFRSAFSLGSQIISRNETSALLVLPYMQGSCVAEHVSAQKYPMALYALLTLLFVWVKNQNRG